MLQEIQARGEFLVIAIFRFPVGEITHMHAIWDSSIRFYTWASRTRSGGRFQGEQAD